MALSPEDYGNLLRFRTALRRFERWSQDRAGDVGLTSAQHQLLLAVTGHPDDLGPTIKDVADYLLIRHHSAVGLVDRTVRAGLLRRIGDPTDARLVRLALTPAGRRRIEQLSEAHLVELHRLAPLLEHLVEELPTLQP